MNLIHSREKGQKGKYLHRFCAILGSRTLSSLILFFMDFLSSRSSSSFLTDDDTKIKLPGKRKMHSQPFCRAAADLRTTHSDSLQIILDYKGERHAIILSYSFNCNAVNKKTNITVYYICCPPPPKKKYLNYVC